VDFSVIFQLRNKKFWWMDVIFYFVISSLVATVLCYFIFLVKNNMQEKDIGNAEVALQTVGTNQQKAYEKEVILYQRKINDFSQLIVNHKFASTVFSFMEHQTRPNIWFKQFNLDQKGGQVQLSGEADDMEAFSRQTSTLEKNEYVKNISLLNSSLGISARVQFNLNLLLDSKIFDYALSSLNETELTQTTTPTSEAPILSGQTSKRSEKLITLFNFPLTPEVIGFIDQTNFTITLDVPYGTNVTNLIPLINISSNASVLPASSAVQDFTNPVIYKVTAEDGSTQNYVVTVNILSKPSPWFVQSKVIIISVSALIAIIIAVAIAVFLFIRKKSKKLPIPN
jgi:hypothetical protein